MTFKGAVEATPQIKDAYRPGLQALRKPERKRVSAEDDRQLTGSVDLDRAVKDAHPNDRRWDYAVAHRPGNWSRGREIVYWIEIHPATSGDVGDVLAKLAWLRKWLSANSPALHKMRCEFIWISSGKTSFTAGAPQQRIMAQQGLRHRGRHFRIPAYAAE